MRIQIMECKCGNEFHVKLDMPGRKPTRCESCRNKPKSETPKVFTPHSTTLTCRTCTKEFEYLVTERVRRLPYYCSPECRPSFKPASTLADPICKTCKESFPRKGNGRQRNNCPRCEEIDNRMRERNKKTKKGSYRTGDDIKPLSGAALAEHLDSMLRERGSHISQHG